MHFRALGARRLGVVVVERNCQSVAALFNSISAARFLQKKRSSEMVGGSTALFYVLHCFFFSHCWHCLHIGASNKNDGEIFVEQHLCCQTLQKIKVKTNKNCQIGKKKHLSAPVRRHILVTEFPYPGRRLFGFLQILVFLFVLRFFLFGQTICVYRLFACPGYLSVFMFFV